jgi:hypothetical protein
MADGLVTLFLCGDVMLGRGVNQVLPHPGDLELRETYAADARAYVRLAERANGPIPQPYFSSVAADTGTLAALRMVPMQARKMRLCHANTADSEWMRRVLEWISHGFGSRISCQPDGALILRPPAADPGRHLRSPGGD